MPTTIETGHRWVSSGHPEDDDPWCRNCGIPLNVEPGSADHRKVQAPCPKAQ